LIFYFIFAYRNLSELEIHWTIFALETLPQEFGILPKSRIIKAKSSCKIGVYFSAIQEQVFDLKIIFHVHF